MTGIFTFPFSGSKRAPLSLYRLVFTQSNYVDCSICKRPNQNAKDCFERHFTQLKYDQESKRIALFAEGREVVQVVSRERIEGNCTLQA